MAEFTGDTRKLVFWYNDKAEFAEDFDSVELENAKIYSLEPDNQFYTKYFLERVDTTTNYLIYAPFSKPDVRDNHLEDTMLYSKQEFKRDLSESNTKQCQQILKEACYEKMYCARAFTGLKPGPYGLRVDRRPGRRGK